MTLQCIMSRISRYPTIGTEKISNNLKSWTLTHHPEILARHNPNRLQYLFQVSLFHRNNKLQSRRKEKASKNHFEWENLQLLSLLMFTMIIPRTGKHWERKLSATVIFKKLSVKWPSTSLVSK